MEPGHTLARGMFLGCAVCLAYKEPNGNPAHDALVMEKRILRGVAAMLVQITPGPGGHMAHEKHVEALLSGSWVWLNERGDLDEGG